MLSVTIIFIVQKQTWKTLNRDSSPMLCNRCGLNNFRPQNLHDRINIQSKYINFLFCIAGIILGYAMYTTYGGSPHPQMLMQLIALIPLLFFNIVFFEALCSIFVKKWVYFSTTYPKYDYFRIEIKAIFEIYAVSGKAVKQFLYCLL